MSDHQELRQLREALAQAVNSHDLETVRSFIHPSFVGKSKRGSSCAGYHDVLRMLEQLFAPGIDYQETVSIEDIEVSGDSARLVVRRVARARSRSEESRAQETWRLIDGRWLLVEEQQRGACVKTRDILVAAVVVVAVGAYVAWGVFTEPTGLGGSGREFQRSGNPALKLEVRQASWSKEVEGWKPMTAVDDRQETMTYHVSPEVVLSNADVLSTGIHFAPSNQKAVSRWKGGAKLLVLSVVLFVVCWRSQEYRRWWGLSGVVALLLGLGLLWHGLTSTAARFDQQGIWQVVIRFNGAGTKTLADLTAPLVPSQKYPPNRIPFPSHHVAFLIDGELHFVAPVWEQHTKGVYYLAQVGLTDADATRIAKGIVGSDAR